MRNIVLIIMAIVCSINISLATPKSGDSRYTGYSGGKKSNTSTSAHIKKSKEPKSKKTKFKTKKGKEPKSNRTHYSAHKRTEPSVFSGFNEELKGFKLQVDLMGGYEFSDSTGMNSPVASLMLAPGCQLTRRFFIGAKGGAIYTFYDILSFPAAFNMHWTWGRKNLIILDTSVGVAICDARAHFYNDLSLGCRIPIKSGHSIGITLGYAIFPQYVSLTNADGDDYRHLMSWFSPQLRVSYGVNIGKKR